MPEFVEPAYGHRGLGDVVPAVGRALEMLMEQRLERGPIDESEAYRLLDAWWADERGD